LIGPLCEKPQFVKHICTCIYIYTYINTFLYTCAIYCWASVQQAHDLDIYMYIYTYIRICTNKRLSNYIRKIILGLFAKSAQFVEHLCQYVCIYVYIYAYIYTYVYTNIIVFPYKYVFPYIYAIKFWASLRKARFVTYTCIYIYMYQFLAIYVCEKLLGLFAKSTRFVEYVCICVHKYVYLYICLYIWGGYD